MLSWGKFSASTEGRTFRNFSEVDTRPRTTEENEETRPQRGQPLPPVDGGGVSLYVIVSYPGRCFCSSQEYRIC